MNLKPISSLLLIAIVSLGVFVVLLISFLVMPSFGEEDQSSANIIPDIDEVNKMGVSIGSNTFIGINLDWYYLKSKKSFAGTLYYRKGDFPDDYILAMDIAYKIYNKQFAYNRFNVYEGLGTGYASVQNPNYGSFSGTYVSNTKYDYLYLTGFLGVIYWGEAFHYFIELQPILSRDGTVVLFKLGAHI